MGFTRKEAQGPCVLKQICPSKTVKFPSVESVIKLVDGLGHAKMCLMPNANTKGADQPAHPRSLISTFIVRCIDSIIPLVSISEISSLYLAPVAEQPGLSLIWSKFLKDTFPRDLAQMDNAMCLL